VKSGQALQRPEIQIYPDYARASQLGVTVEALGDALRLATYGDYSARLNKLNLPQRQIDVRVRLNPETRNDLSHIGLIRVAGSKGQVALSSLADIRMGGGAAQIDRLDRYRNVTISVELNGRSLGEVMNEVRELPSMRNLPTGVFTVQQGELQRMSELFSSFGLAMEAGIICIYVVLVLLFHDFLQPATILAALPLSLGGALLALIVTRNNFSMPAIIGLLMLMGVVTKNSILLVEYAIMARREKGMSRFDALVDACHKRSRPIFMTTIAMGAGMLPIALGLGADPSFRQPMAIIVIGGLMTSTLLSLLIIPVLYTYVDDLLHLIPHRFLPDRQDNSNATAVRPPEAVTADRA
jgi:multidrug efflux pump subunit AcrB